MRRSILFILALPVMLAGVVMAASPALATNPHFISVSGQLSGSNLIVSWMEAGLGNNLQISYTTNADATAVFVCVNGGNKNPSAANKTTVSGPVSATGTFSSGKNGNISASLTLNPPGPGSFSCPSGQSLEVASVTYSNVTLTDTTTPVGPVTVGTGTFSTGCLLPKVKGACS